MTIEDDGVMDMPLVTAWDRVDTTIRNTEQIHTGPITSIMRGGLHLEGTTPSFASCRQFERRERHGYGNFRKFSAGDRDRRSWTERDFGCDRRRKPAGPIEPGAIAEQL